MSFYRGLINVLTIIAMFVIFQSIMTFFNISISNYIMYLAWFIALLLFYFILPNSYKFFKD
jgi:hypothetical protein